MLKLLDKINSPLKLAFKNRISMYKSEDHAYISAYLANINSKLQSISFDELTENKKLELYSLAYEETNLLYAHEQAELANAEYIEQSYNIFSSMHKLLRKYDLIYDVKKEETKQLFNITDPNTFPVYDLTYKYKTESDYISVGSILDEYYFNLLKETGFNLRVKKSNIKHMESHDGVFIDCYNKELVYPGTLLGFYPGVYYSYNNYQNEVLDEIEDNSVLKNSSYPYLKRHDNTYLDPYVSVPYPLFNNITLYEFNKYLKSVEESKKKLKYVNIPLYKINSLALGHKINHPPPNKEANVKFIDFDIPASFFPISFLRYMPNIKSTLDNPLKQSINIIKYLFNYKMDSNLLSNRFIRLTGIVTIKDVKDREELYADYM